MIEVDQLVKRFGAVTAVDGLSFTVRPGHVTGFLGPNGAGKTTTMRVILGLDAPTSGRALVNSSSYHRPDPPAAPGRRAAGRDRPAPRADRDGAPGLDRAEQRHRAPPGRRDAPADRPGGGREPQAQGVLARHEAAARHRRGAARRPAGADVRRAGQRPGHRGHRLDPPVHARPGRRRPHRPGLQPPDERDGADRRPADRHRPRPPDRRHHHRPAHRVQRPQATSWSAPRGPPSWPTSSKPAAPP